jgi:Domain of unknown function (DUF1905)
VRVWTLKSIETNVRAHRSHLAARYVVCVPEFRTRFNGELWEWDGAAAWHFISLPGEVADHIRELFGGRAGGFGSVRVEVTIGSSRWRTSVFPDKSRDTYLLPVKKQIRMSEQLEAGSTAAVEFVVLVE